MNNDNFNICSNCGEKNPLFILNCRKCSHYTRENVVNIDLWKTLFQLFDAPKKTLKKIIYAEHKNFVTLLLFVFSVKLYLTSIIIQSSLNYIQNESDFSIYNSLTTILIYSVIIILFALLLKVFLKKIKRETRFKDNISITVYSFSPIILASIILTPIEYGIFGQYWFIYNPSPFLIKPVTAYILAAIEIIMLIWSITILFKGFYLQSDSIKITILTTTLFLIVITIQLLFMPYILF